MEKVKMYSYVVIRNDGEDPVVYVGAEKEKVLNKANLFAEKYGEKIYEVENIAADCGDLTSVCYVEIKNGIPCRVLHDYSDDPGKNYWLASYEKI